MHSDLGRTARARVLLVALLGGGCATDPPEAFTEARAQQAPVVATPSTEPATGAPGTLAGTTVWRFPATGNGLVPNQSWFSVGGTPDGTIYTSGCDHLSNSALYRVTPGDDRLTYVGDARRASEAAGNWRAGETAEKFHVRPLWYQGRVYIATADYSNQDDAYLSRRGFHWYGYDDARGFVDLSAKDAGGVGAEHISLFATAVDTARGFIYGLGSPTAHLYRYEIATGITTDLGRPPELTRPYYNPGRFLWVDAQGTVYFTVGTAGTLTPGEPATPLYVLSWSPTRGWAARPDWPISEMLRTGQWSRDGKRLYVLDYQLNLYLFDDDAQSFIKITQGALTPQHVSPRTRGVRVRSVHVSANEKKIYFINDTASTNSLWEWDFRNEAAPRELTTIARIDPRVDARYNAFTGHDAWDGAGRFYFTGFAGEGVPNTPDVYLLRVDPVRIKAALGVLPGVPVLTLEKEGADQVLVRAGDAGTELTVLLEHAGESGVPYKVTLPPGMRRMRLLDAPGPLRVLPDGDTYVTR